MKKRVLVYSFRMLIFFAFFLLLFSCAFYVDPDRNAANGTVNTGLPDKTAFPAITATQETEIATAETQTEQTTEPAPGETQGIQEDPTEYKYIAFTFDDGPNPGSTKLILDLVEQYDIKVTFFVQGWRLYEGSKLVKETLKRADALGCEIGNHAYSHPNFWNISLSDALYELTRTDDLIRDIIGKETVLMRPPYGNFTSDIQKNCNKFIILWSTDTEDWRIPRKEEVTVESVIEHIIRKTADGSIVLMHDIYYPSAEVFEAVIPLLLEDDFKFVTVSELLALEGKTPDGTPFYHR